MQKDGETRWSSKTPEAQAAGDTGGMPRRILLEMREVDTEDRYIPGISVFLLQIFQKSIVPGDGGIEGRAML